MKKTPTPNATRVHLLCLGNDISVGMFEEVLIVRLKKGGSLEWMMGKTKRKWSEIRFMRRISEGESTEDARGNSNE